MSPGMIMLPQRVTGYLTKGLVLDVRIHTLCLLIKTNQETLQTIESIDATLVGLQVIEGKLLLLKTPHAGIGGIELNLI